MSLFTILEGEAKKSDKKGAVKSGKSRVRVFATIAKALEQGHVGQAFSTKGADRRYVISKASWGKKSMVKLIVLVSRRSTAQEQRTRSKILRKPQVKNNVNFRYVYHREHASA